MERTDLEGHEPMSGSGSRFNVALPLFFRRQSAIRYLRGSKFLIDDSLSSLFKNCASQATFTRVRQNKSHAFPISISL